MKNFRTNISLSAIALSIMLIVSGCGLNVDIAKRHHQPGFYFNVSFDNNKQIAEDRQNIEADELATKKAPGLRNNSKVIVSQSPELRSEVNSEENTSSVASTIVTSSKKDGNKVRPEIKIINSELYAATIPFMLKSFSISNVEKSFETSNTQSGGKSQLIALILALTVGILGIHRFYLGYIGAGVIQLLTGGVCGIWTLIDIIRIITGDLQPKDGPYTDTF